MTLTSSTLPTETEMFQAILDRDGAYDGIFVTAVRTTGIFCRPTCPARKPRRENVEFFAGAADALRAGYRPCRRCRPLESGEPAPAWARRLMTMVEEAPHRRLTDADLRALSIDPASARRYFQQRFGVTFHAWQRAWRLGRSLGQLKSGAGVTQAGLGHGFESESGFRDAFHRLFGAAPGAGRGLDCLVVRWIDTPIGAFIAAATGDGVCLFEFADRRGLETQIAAVRGRHQLAALPGTNDHLELLQDEIAGYFAGPLQAFTVPLVTGGTPFQELVWRALREIPYGDTRSYDQIARAIGRPGASRAVGRANGQNRIAILIPCHRVVAADGSLCGYGGGLWRKRRLLELERRSNGIGDGGSDRSGPVG